MEQIPRKIWKLDTSGAYTYSKKYVTKSDSAVILNTFLVGKRCL
jgi:hypothetical protein